MSITTLDNEVNNFLIKQKDSFLKDLNSNKDLSSWVISIGNEAGDLDSLACAIATAYLSSKLNSTSTTQYISLIQTSSTDLYLRPENLLALSSAYISQTSLLYLSDIPKERLTNVGCKYFLVDQNKLTGIFGEKNEVISILDHHVDEGIALEAKPRTIIPFIVGSCSSLVTNYFSALLPKLPSNLVDLLLSALLIDTSLKPLTTGGKAGEEDDKAAKFLISSSPNFASPSTSTTSTSSALVKPTGELALKLEALTASKFDVDNMSGRDLLRRDYKEYTSQENGFQYGLSTVPVGFTTWLEKVKLSSDGKTNLRGWKAIESDLESWVEERGLDMLGVLTSFTGPPEKKVKKSIGEVLKTLTDSKAEKEAKKKDKKGKKGKHEREILIYTKNDKLVSTFKGLESDTTLDLIEWKGLKRSTVVMPKVQDRKWRIWSQNNASATRKQVAPILKGLVVSTASRRRLVRDFKRLSSDPPGGISGAPCSDNIMIWNAVIFGPTDTPFEDGTFRLVLTFDESYPNKPPTVKFLSKMFHPNVYANGELCLDILQNRWSPTYDVAAILTSIQSLLHDPNPNSPANAEAAQLFREDMKSYVNRVRKTVESSWMDE